MSGLADPTYYEGFPLHYYWMDEYQPVMAAVEASVGSKPMYVGSTDEELAEVVGEHLLRHPLPESR